MTDICRTKVSLRLSSRTLALLEQLELRTGLGRVQLIEMAVSEMRAEFLSRWSDEEASDG